MNTLQQADSLLQNALRARAEGDLEDAEHCLEQALETYYDLRRPDRVLIASINLGAIALISGRLDLAESRFLDALHIAEQLSSPPHLALCQGNLAAIHLERGDGDAAEPLLQKALETYRALDNHAGAGNQLGNLGMLYQNRGELERARVYLQQAAEAFVQAENPYGAAGVLRVLGTLARREGKLDQALEAIERALVIARNVNDTAGEAYALRQLGQIHLSAGKLERALTFFTQSLEGHQSVGDRKGIASAHLDLGQAHASLGHPQEAVAALRQAYTLARDAQLAEAEAGAALALGTQLNLTGHTEEGRTLLHHAEALFLKIEDPFGIAASRVNLATLDLQEGRWDTLEPDLHAELIRCDHHQLHMVTPTLHALLGQLAQRRGHLLEAIDSLERAAEGFAHIGKQRRALSSRLSRALLLLERQQTDGLEAELQDVLEHFQGFGEPSGQADALQTLGELCRVEKRWDDALDHYNAAEAMLRKLDNPNATASLHFSRAELLLRRERWDAPTSEHVDAALRDVQAALDIAQTHALQPKLALLYAIEADALRRQGQLEDAESRIVESLGLAHTLSYPMALARAAQIQARIAHNRGQDAIFRATLAEARERYERMGARVHLAELDEDFAA